MTSRLLFLLFLIITGKVIFAGENPVNHSKKSTIAFTVNERGLYPEGIAYDPITRQFFVSSIGKQKIVSIDKDGNQYDFIETGQDSMLCSLGLKVDKERRRLWIVSNSDWDSTMISAVHIYDIDTRKLLKRHFTKVGKEPTFNDLVITDSGEAYISDYGGNSIYHISASLDKVELFLHSDSLLFGANGIAISPDNTFLYVASDTNGIVLVDLNNKVIQPIGNSLRVNTGGIDGLLIHNNTLIGVVTGLQDYTKAYIARYTLSEDGREIIEASIIDDRNPIFQIPTTITMAGNDLYCMAATYLQFFGQSNTILNKQSGEPVVLKYKIKE